MKIAVLGAGAWGTGMALQLAQRHKVQLWSREADVAEAMQHKRYNQRYLPDLRLPESIEAHAGTAHVADVADCDLVMVACPVAGLREQLAVLRGLQKPLVWLCKGFEEPQDGASAGLLPHEVMAQVAPELRAGVLSGPSFAQEVARSQKEHQQLAQVQAQLQPQARQPEQLRHSLRQPRRSRPAQHRLQRSRRPQP